MVNYSQADIQKAYNVCIAITKKSSSNFYTAVKTLPKLKQQSIFAIYAFCRKCDDAVDSQQFSNKITMTKVLDELKLNLEKTYKGNPSGYLWLALYDTYKNFGVGFEQLANIIEGCRMDIFKYRYETFDDLMEYCSKVAGAVGIACIQVFGYKNHSAIELANTLGLGMQLINIVRDVREDLELGRIYIPQDEFARYNYSQDELMNRVNNANWLELIKFQVTRAAKYIKEGADIIPLIDKQARLCPSAMIQSYSALLESIVNSQYDVLNRRVSISSRKKLLLAGKFFIKSKLVSLQIGTLI